MPAPADVVAMGPLMAPPVICTTSPGWERTMAPFTTPLLATRTGVVPAGLWLMAMPLPASSVIVPVFVMERPLPVVAMERAAPVPALRMVPVLLMATRLAELPIRIALPPAAPPVWMVPPLLMVMAEEKPPMLTAKLPVLVLIRPVLLTVMLVALGLIWKVLLPPIVPVLASVVLLPMFSLRT